MSNSVTETQLLNFEILFDEGIAVDSSLSSCCCSCCGSCCCSAASTTTPDDNVKE